MRTTVALEPQTLEEARKQALAQRVSLGKYIEAALREKLASEVKEPVTPYRPLKSFRGTGVRPGVDLNDSAGLLDEMDSPQ
jgi:hypothetical protein